MKVQPCHLKVLWPLGHHYFNHFLPSHTDSVAITTMIERIHQPDLDIPHSDVTITTKVLDLVTIHGSNCNNLHHPPIEGVEVVRPVPSLSFLLEHHSGQKLLFDLGVPTDLRTLGSEVADRLKKVGHQITVQKDVVDALEEHNIKREDINAVIWRYA